MDSITQIALGAAVGEATLGRQVGRRALLWGGVCGLLPDLDLFIPYSDAVKTFTYHRSFSHSLFVLAALTPLMVALIRKLHPAAAQYRNKWYLLVYLAFATHVILDSFTVYGTQIFWPLTTPPAMWSTIFIIDPAYSIPLFGGVLAALVMSRKTQLSHRISAIGLVLSTLYLMWCAGAKLYVDQVAQASLARQSIAYQKMLSIPAPFNSILWRVVVMESDGYYEGFYSLLDPSPNITFVHYPSEPQLLDPIAAYWPVKRLKWFTHGFYAVRQQHGDIVITDLRMGMEPSYVFRFKVASVGNPHITPTRPEQVYDERDWGRLRWVWERIWTPHPGPMGA
jgi:inner membrane protein